MHVTTAQVPTQSLKIFSPATSVPTSHSHTYAPERSLIQALGLMTYSAQRNAYEKLAG